ncbi:MAG TPA: Bax inhibitor-1 family protein [Terriglobales bacterium]|nr:Bax inhibitor-1 family protein [Terriglobales bacterium]
MDPAPQPTAASNSQPTTGLEDQPSSAEIQAIETADRKFLIKVFLWIIGALVVSALFAGPSDQSSLLANPVLSYQAVSLAIGGLLLAAVFISHKVDKMPGSVAMATLLAYAGVQGWLFGRLFQMVYRTSLAPVYFVIAVIFGGCAAYGWYFERDVTSWRSLGLGCGLGAAMASLMRLGFGFSIIEALLIFFGTALLIAIVSYHRDYLRDLPDSFENDPQWHKAAAVGALQIYVDLVVIVVVVIQARWLTEAMDESQKARNEERKAARRRLSAV